LEKDGRVAEHPLGELLRCLDLTVELRLASDNAHTDAAAARRRFDEQRIADVTINGGSVEALTWRYPPASGGHRHLEPACEIAGPLLVAHSLDSLRRRPDPDISRRLHGAGKARILGEQAIARMYGVRAAPFHDVENGVDLEITLADRWRPDLECLIGEADMQRVPVRFRIDGNGPNSHRAAGAYDTAGDLAAVGDQQLFNRSHLLLHSQLGVAGDPCPN